MSFLVIHLKSTRGNVKNKCIWKWKCCKWRTGCNIHSRDADQPCFLLQCSVCLIPVLLVHFWSHWPTSIKLDRTDTWPLLNSTVSLEVRGYVEVESHTAALPERKGKLSVTYFTWQHPAGCLAQACRLLHQNMHSYCLLPASAGFLSSTSAP